MLHINRKSFINSEPCAGNPVLNQALSNGRYQSNGHRTGSNDCGTEPQLIFWVSLGLKCDGIGSLAMIDWTCSCCAWSPTRSWCLVVVRSLQTFVRWSQSPCCHGAKGVTPTECHYIIYIYTYITYLYIHFFYVSIICFGTFMVIEGHKSPLCCRPVCRKERLLGTVFTISGRYKPSNYGRFTMEKPGKLDGKMAG